jgi:sugar porter (SP) family MFS transporter
MCAGALVGSLVAGPLADRVGRRVAILSTNLPYLVGLAILSLAQNYWMLLIGRSLVGVGVGGSCIAVPLYLTEISSVATRGLIGSAHQMAIVVGFLVAEIFGYLGLSRPYYWRIMFALDMIPCIIQILGMLAVSPESPRYLITNDRLDEGRQALLKLRAKHFRDDTEYNEIVRSCDSARSTENWGLRQLLFTHRERSLKSMAVASILHLGQQLSGINPVLLFSASIFAVDPPRAGNEAETSVVPLLISLLNFLMTVAAICMIDRTGRRFLALSSSGIMFLSSIVLTAAFILGQRLISIIAVLAFVGSFAFGMGPVPWLMTNEIFPTQAVGSAVSFAVALNWISNMIVTVSFPKLLESLQNYALIPYSICILLFFAFAYTALPETKGRPVGFI